MSNKYNSTKKNKQFRLFGVLSILTVVFLVLSIIMSSFYFSLKSSTDNKILENEKTISDLNKKVQDLTNSYGSQQKSDFAYQTAHPEMYAPLPIPAPVEPEEKTVFLTFDDGPSANTPKVLDILKQYDAKATFFLVPKDSAESDEYIKRIVDEGHAVGVHSDSHNYEKIYASVDAFFDDFEIATSRILKVTGKMPEIFRFPGGSINAYNMNNYKQIIAELLRRGYVYYDWNVDSFDAASKLTPASKISASVTEGVSKRKNPIVLMHDAAGKTTTVDALPSILSNLKSQGYKFGTMDRTTPRVTFDYKDMNIK